MATPESRVKDALKFELRDAELDQGQLYVHWPVLTGMGAPEIDCNILYKGQAYAVECKGPGKQPTAQQWDTLNAKRRAGAWCFVLGGLWAEYRGRPLAKADNMDLGLILEFIRTELPTDDALARKLNHDNWKKYGGTYA